MPAWTKQASAERERELPSKLHCTYSATLVYTPAQAGIGAGAMASLGKVRMAPARKTNYPTQQDPSVPIGTHRYPTGPNPITAPILRHIGITTDVRKGRLDGLFVVFPLLVIRKSLRIKSCGETCWLGRKDPPRKN